MVEKRERLTPEQAKERIRHYCAYSERCHSDVRDRLYGFGLGPVDIDPIISMLIEEDYLNEERFATQFAGGHFRLKNWGRVKIQHALRARGVSEYCIKKALNEIDEDLYQGLLKKLASQKWNTLRGQLPAQRWAKTRQFLLQRGFESHLVLLVLKIMDKPGSH